MKTIGLIKMRTPKTKKFVFELIVDESFNPYKFFHVFKRIQNKGFFKEIKGISKLNEKGESEEMKLSILKETQHEEFILTEKYGVQ